MNRDDAILLARALWEKEYKVRLVCDLEVGEVSIEGALENREITELNLIANEHNCGLYLTEGKLRFVPFKATEFGE